MVEHNLAMVVVRVRFPSFAYKIRTLGETSPSVLIILSKKDEKENEVN